MQVEHVEHRSVRQVGEMHEERQVGEMHVERQDARGATGRGDAGTPGRPPSSTKRRGGSDADSVLGKMRMRGGMVCPTAIQDFRIPHF